jgi:hypothetical protein
MWPTQEVAIPGSKVEDGCPFGSGPYGSQPYLMWPTREVTVIRDLVQKLRMHWNPTSRNSIDQDRQPWQSWQVFGVSIRIHART